MKELEDTKKYNHLEINGVLFSNVQVFILNSKIEIVDSWGRVNAVIRKEDIKTVNI